MPRAGRAVVPSEFPDALTWAAWLYFVDEMTQSEVAQKVWRFTCYGHQAIERSQGKGDRQRSDQPQRCVHDKYVKASRAEIWLNSVMIIPDNDELPLTERIGKAGGFAISEALCNGDIIGIAWGRTVLSAARNVALESPFADLTVVQFCSSPNGLSADFSPELCASLLANNLGARSASLMVPAIVASPELRSLLLQEPTIRKQFNVIKSANKVVFGVVELGEGATLRSSELYSETTFDKLAKKGEVAVILGELLDQDGNGMTNSTQDRTIGISLAKFKEISNRLCVAGGLSKVQAIHAALIGGFATDLITDFSTARALLGK
ncbi:MAG: sugar-binding domain-containing protein [Paracoccaceae bacterium]